MTELKAISLRIDADERLAAAAGGAARYLADNSGLEDAAASQLQAAVIAACAQAFEYLNHNHPYLNVTLLRHSDRIEVEISHQGEGAPGVGPGSTSESASQASGGMQNASKLNGIDRVEHERRDHVEVTRLTKYISQGIPSR